jgi:hypothetical protein
VKRLLFLLPLFVVAETQPIPFSHRVHAEAKLVCRDCHTNPDPGEVMGLPAESRCMACHRSIKTDSPHIQKLASFVEQKRSVPWKRLWLVPSYVWFGHRTHGEAGVRCVECHGPTDQRDVVTKEVSASMGACMQCHTERKVSNDCGFCHEPR